MADDSQRHFHSSPPLGSWEHVYPHSHHGTPAQEYSGFTFPQRTPPMEPGAFSGSIQPRPGPPPLQPLIMPQWPSMLNSQSHASYQQVYAQPVHPIQPIPVHQLQTPISAVSTRSAPTPRRTLTDQDRKRMCQYHEEHPNAKQTEIGAHFGVERSTVSKVLRQKEKYLQQDDGGRSPVKRAKGRSPDIERALAMWAKNQEKRGLPLSDDLIREKARMFSTTSPTPETHRELSTKWLEKFKHKHNLMGARSRKSSLAPDDAENISSIASTAHSPTDLSPSPPQGAGSPSPVELRSVRSDESLQHEMSPDEYLGYMSRNGPFITQSETPFEPNAPSALSPGPTSPTSPFFSPESGTAPGPFIPAPPPTARPILPAPSSSNSHRPRSQTFPLLDQYMATPTSAEPLTPKFLHNSVLDSPMEEASDPLPSIDAATAKLAAEEQRTVSPGATMRPPPLPAHVKVEKKREIQPATSESSLRSSSTTTSPEEALRALEIVNGFLEQQPSGFLDYSESMTMGKLMEKLRLQSRASSQQAS